jgi:CubicO group peptidase (beta-lactamase class C family)
MNSELAQRLGFDLQRLSRLGEAVARDVDARRYDGAVLHLARGADTVLHAAVGYAERDKERRLKTDDVFFTFSIAKQFTHVLALAAVERGDLSLTTRVAEVIPEFGCRGKENVTLFHLLTHTSGLTLKLPLMDPMQIGNLDAVVAAACASMGEFMPGGRVYYSGLVGVAVIAEMLRRTEHARTGAKRALRDILAQDLFQPLGMRDTALGLRADLAPRLCPVVARDRAPGVSTAEEYEMFAAVATEQAEIPALGCVSTAADLARFAQMLRNRGTLDGVRLLSPAICDLALRIHTGTLPNEMMSYTAGSRGWKAWPANLGLGFFLRGDGLHPHPFGTLASPGTFGGLGAGSTMFWVDPARDLSFVFVSAGLITDESRNIDRLQRISDLIFAALVH